VVGIAACGASAKPDAPPADPKAPATEPAVVAVPLNLPHLAVDTNTKPKSNLIPEDPTQRQIAVADGYSLAATTMILQDGRTLASLYHPDAVLHTPDSTVTGAPAVTRQLLTLARNKSLSEFQRTSNGIRIVDDSTLVDSGSYVMVLKRTAKDSVFERGKYATKWRARADVTKWVMLDDQFRPGAPSKKSGK
ncbi:MAG: nuclear transport factor 2 family protein, partial [Gemmatimonadaceae bacterium]|nr:nuclear transport factor 2 family protein [Gemmatimonadaceae bacterium]